MMKIVNDKEFYEMCGQAKEGIIERMLKTINLDVVWLNDSKTQYGVDKDYADKYTKGFEKLMLDFIDKHSEGVSDRAVEMAKTSVSSIAHNMNIDILNTTLTAMKDITGLRKLITNGKKLREAVDAGKLTENIDIHLKDESLSKVGRRILGIAKCTIATIYKNTFRVGLVDGTHNQSRIRQRNIYTKMVEAYRVQCIEAYDKSNDLYDQHFKCDLDVLLEQDTYYKDLGIYSPEYKLCLATLNIGHKTPLPDKMKARCVYRTQLERLNKELCSKGNYGKELDEVNAKIDEADTWLDLINDYHDIGEVRTSYYRDTRPTLLSNVDKVYNTDCNYESLVDVVKSNPPEEALKVLQHYRKEFDNTTIGNYTLTYVENILNLADRVINGKVRPEPVKYVEVNPDLPDNIVRIYQALGLPPIRAYNDVELEEAKDIILNQMPIPLNHENLIQQGKLTDYVYVASLYMLETKPELWAGEDSIGAEQMALWIREQGYEWKINN